MTPAKPSTWFSKSAKVTAHATGQPASFGLAAAVVLVWGISGPLFHSELLRISPGAHNVLIDLEELEERELDRIKAVYALLAAQARSGVSHGRSDSGVPAINDLVEKQVHKPRRKKKS